MLNGWRLSCSAQIGQLKYLNSYAPNKSRGLRQTAFISPQFWSWFVWMFNVVVFFYCRAKTNTRIANSVVALELFYPG